MRASDRLYVKAVAATFNGTDPRIIDKAAAKLRRRVIRPLHPYIKNWELPGSQEHILLGVLHCAEAETIAAQLVHPFPWLQDKKLAELWTDFFRAANRALLNVEKAIHLDGGDPEFDPDDPTPPTGRHQLKLRVTRMIADGLCEAKRNGFDCGTRDAACPTLTKVSDDDPMHEAWNLCLYLGARETESPHAHSRNAEAACGRKEVPDDRSGVSGCTFFTDGAEGSYDGIERAIHELDARNFNPITDDASASHGRFLDGASQTAQDKGQTETQILTRKSELDAQELSSRDEPTPEYKIVKELHRGGQGVVYQAVQRSTKLNVALKVTCGREEVPEKAVVSGCTFNVDGAQDCDGRRGRVVYEIYDRHPSLALAKAEARSVVAADAALGDVGRLKWAPESFVFLVERGINANAVHVLASRIYEHDEVGRRGPVPQQVGDGLAETGVGVHEAALEPPGQPAVEGFHDRTPLGLVEPQAGLGGELLLAGDGIVAVGLAQALQNIAARLGELRCHIDEVASAVGEAVGHEGLEFGGQIARESVAHLDQRAEVCGAPGQYGGQVFTGVNPVNQAISPDESLLVDLDTGEGTLSFIDLVSGDRSAVSGCTFDVDGAQGSNDGIERAIHNARGTTTRGNEDTSTSIAVEAVNLIRGDGLGVGIDELESLVSSLVVERIVKIVPYNRKPAGHIVQSRVVSFLDATV